MDWTVVRRHAGKFTRACPSTTGASNHAEDSHAPDKLKLKLIPMDDCIDRPLDLPRDPRPLEDDLLYSNALLFLLRNLLVVGLPLLGGLACRYIGTIRMLFIFKYLRHASYSCRICFKHFIDQRLKILFIISICVSYFFVGVSFCLYIR